MENITEEKEPEDFQGFNGLHGKKVQAMVEFDYRPGLYVAKGSIGVVEEDWKTAVMVKFPDAIVGPECGGPIIPFIDENLPDHKTLRDKVLWSCQLLEEDNKEESK